MSEIRKYKLYKLGIEQKPLYKKIFEFLDSKILELTRYTNLQFPHYVFYIDKNKNCIFVFDPKQKTIEIRYEDFWAVLEKAAYEDRGFNVFGLIKSIITNNYEIEVTNSRRRLVIDMRSLERTLFPVIGHVR